jgi:hypothetical protein
MKKIIDPTTGILGIDLGNTIIRNRVVIPRALETLSRLEVVFGKRMHIISRVTPEQQVRAEAFMRTEDFLASTKITPDRQHFCRERHEKGEICRKLGITIMIDDRPEVILSASSVTHPILFSPSAEDMRIFGPQITHVPVFQSWDEVGDYILSR